MFRKETSLLAVNTWFLKIICIFSFFIVGLNVTVTTSPEGPPFRAGSSIVVNCSASNGSPPYEYKWSVGCSYTNIMSNFVVARSVLGPLTTTGISCHDIYKCIVTDMKGTTSEVGQITIKPITGKLYIYSMI